MIRDAAQTGAGSITGKNDMRITPIGHFLRNSKIDEFPQLINILKGDMSLVGARPLMRVPDFESYSPEVQAVIYNTRPGVTAIGSVVFRDEAQLISQVQEEGGDARQFKQEVVFPYKGQLEMWYQENKSLWVDFKILFLTAWTLIFSTSQLAFKAFDGLPERPARLMREFDRMQELKENVSLVLLVLLVLIPLIPPPFWFYNNPHFIVMALIPLLSFGYLLFGQRQSITVQLIPSDIGWGVFLLAGLLSYFWAVDGSLVWYPVFTWLSLVLWMLLLRSLSNHPRLLSILPILFGAFFLMIMVQHLAAISVNVAVGRSWNAFFGKNANYTTTLLVGVYPFLLFYPSNRRILEIIKFVFTFLVLGILYVTGVKWATLGFVFVGIYYLWNQRANKELKGVEIALTIICLGTGIFFLNRETVNLLAVGNESQGLDISFRYHLLQSSIANFLEYPLLGIGFGNWHIEAFKNGVEAIPVLNNPSEFIRLRSHNVYLEHLVELGIIGGLAFLIPFLDVIRRNFNSNIKFTAFQQAAFASLLVYLVGSFFYCDVNAYRYHFSAIQLIAFCSLGILTSSSNAHYSLPKWINGIFMVLAIAASIWFVHAKQSYDHFQKSQLSDLPIPERIQQLESIYHPVFQTTHDYNHSIPYELAKLYQKNKNYAKANIHYQEALQLNPYHEPLLLHYAQFLFHIQEQPIEAKRYAQQVYMLQPNHYQTNLLLAEIADSENEKTTAEKYLSALKGMENYEEIVAEFYEK